MFKEFVFIMILGWIAISMVVIPYKDTHSPRKSKCIMCNLTKRENISIHSLRARNSLLNFGRSYPEEFFNMRKGLFRHGTTAVVFAVQPHHTANETNKRRDNMFFTPIKHEHGPFYYCAAPSAWLKFHDLANEILLPPFQASGISGESVVLPPSACQGPIRRLARVLKSSLAPPPSSRTLVIVATANRIHLTIDLLESIKKCKDEFDLLFIDENSYDGTAEYLQSKGYAVIAQKASRGRLHSWNAGYRVARTLGYRYVAFTSNQVSIPSGSISVLRAALGERAVVMPVTTALGAGDNSVQSLLQMHQNIFCKRSVYFNQKCSRINYENGDTPDDIDTSRLYEPYIVDHIHMQSTQNHLSTHFENLMEREKYTKDSPVVDNPCSAKSHERFGSVGLKKSSTIFSLRAHEQVLPSGTLGKSPRGQSNEAKACQEKLLRDSRKEHRRQELEYLARQTDMNQLNPLVESKNETNFIFNSMFFMVNMLKIRPSSFDEKNLFYPSALSTTQAETIFVERLLQYNVKPYICPFSFVYYSTSPEESAASPENHESQYYDILSLLRTKSSVPHRVVAGRSAAAPAATNSLPPVVIGMAISYWRKTPTAGDIFTARELSHSLGVKYNVVIKYLCYEEDWYNVETLDVLIVYLDYYDLSRVYNRKPGLVQVAWMRNWFQRWLSRPYIGNYDLLLVSSTVAEEILSSGLPLPVQCLMRCPGGLQGLSQTRRVLPVRLFLLAANEDLFRPLDEAGRIISVNTLAADYVFTGSYWEATRDIMALDPSHPKLREFSGSIIGKQWQQAVDRGEVQESWLRLLKGEVPYGLLPDIYRGSKVVIDDANHVTKSWGSVNSRVFDALAAGVLVITNGKMGSEDAFQGKLPVFESNFDLVSLLDVYLNDQSKREQEVKALRQIVLQQHTYSKRADELAQHINTLLGNSLVLEKTLEMPKGRSSPSICIGIRVYEGQPLKQLELLLHSLELQRNTMAAVHLPFDLSYFVVNTDSGSSPHYKSQLEELIETFNNPLGSDPRAWLFDYGDSFLGRTAFVALRGYDVLEKLIKLLQSREECEWIMITNGDNVYNQAWFPTILPLVHDLQVQMIGWDFVSHTMRDGFSQQTVQISLQENSFDLGAVLVRKLLIVESGAQFLPSSVFTQGLATRDWGFIQTCVGSLKVGRGVSLVHKVLMMQQ